MIVRTYLLYAPSFLFCPWTCDAACALGPPCLRATSSPTLKDHQTNTACLSPLTSKNLENLSDKPDALGASGRLIDKIDLRQCTVRGPDQPQSQEQPHVALLVVMI